MWESSNKTIVVEGRSPKGEGAWLGERLNQGGEKSLLSISNCQVDYTGAQGSPPIPQDPTQ